MTASLAQFKANLANSLNSTGPNTTHGKSKSKLNAIRHGLTAQTVLLPNEDALAYRALCQQFLEHCKPANIFEKIVVQEIADAAWRLGRCFALSENVFSAGHFTRDANCLMGDPALHAAVTAPRVLKNSVPSFEAVSRATARLERSMHAAMAQLTMMQDARHVREQEELVIAAELRTHLKAANIPFEPLKLGFVCTIEEIDIHIRREAVFADARAHGHLLPKGS